MLAVAFGPPNMAEALRLLPRVVAEADCVELRLDLFAEGFDLPTLLRERGGLPSVVTLRPPDQGGQCTLPTEDRLKVLLEAAELGAEYVDLEFDAVSAEALRELRARGARVIVSRHDFAGMPPELADDWWPRLAELGADVVKVVGTATDLRDNLSVLRPLQRADRPTIAIAMGAAGQLSRVLALRSDRCLLTYAALDDGAGTAPGQLTVSELRDVYCAGRIGPGTRVYGLLGPHDETERVREYNAWFARDRYDGVAVPFAASGGAAGIVSAFRALPVSGWHVHGEALQRDVVAELDALRSGNGRANAIVRTAEGALRGEWVESPRQQYELWASAG
jgi:3-dehydroquinate dehydratase / shikimate dehydrogenase